MQRGIGVLQGLGFFCDDTGFLVAISTMSHPNPTALKVLTSDQIEQFVEEGYTMLPGAFPRTVAETVHRFIVGRTGVNPDDASTWTKPVVHLQESHDGEPFEGAFTPRLEGAFDDLMGEGRWILRHALGWWPVVFPGFSKAPWQEPTAGWHVDGIQFHHHIDSPDQALLPIFLFNDMGPGDGGTCISPGSHKAAARILRDAEPDGLDVHTLASRVSAHRGGTVEVRGEAGDVALMHPFMLHTMGINIGKSVRVICNPCVRFKERMNVTADPTRPFSAVERSIHAAVSEQARL